MSNGLRCSWDECVRDLERSADANAPLSGAFKTRAAMNRQIDLWWATAAEALLEKHLPSEYAQQVWDAFVREWAPVYGRAPKKFRSR